MKNSVNESIFSLAYLQYTYEVLHKDILDPYIPMFCRCILEKNINPIGIKEIKEAMTSIYGISNLTYGAVQVICDRMATSKVGILEKKDGMLYVNKEKLYTQQAELRKDDSIIEDFERLALNISNYSQNFPKTYDKKEVEDGLMHFIDYHGVDLLCGQEKEVFHKILKNEDKRLAYVISRYVIDDKDKGGNAVDLLNRLAKGNTISNLVSLSGHSNYAGNLQNVTIVIDTPFFYNLLGANCDSNRDAAEELMSILKRNGAHFSMYQHNLLEVYSALDDAIQRLRTHNYDLRKSSRLLKMAITEGFSSLQMETMRTNVDVILHRWNIKEEFVPDVPNGYVDIDAQTLKDIIEEAYTKNHTRDLFHHEINMIEKDIDSICFTYRIRGNSIVENLKGCKALMLTTNKIIAATSNDERINRTKHKIPVCATDIFLSCILWSNYPDKNDSLNKKLLISECYNNILVDDTLITKFYEDIKAKRLARNISESQYMELTTSRLAISLLSEKTQNDIEAYTDRTSAEILAIIEQEHRDEVERVRKEGEDKVNAFREQSEENKARLLAEHKVALDTKDDQICNLQDQIRNVEKRCEGIANFFSHIFSGLITLVLLFLFWNKGNLVQLFEGNCKLLNWWWIGIDGLLTLWAALNWLGWIPKYVDLKAKIWECTFKICKRVLLGN